MVAGAHNMQATALSVHSQQQKKLQPVLAVGTTQETPLRQWISAAYHAHLFSLQETPDKSWSLLDAVHAIKHAAR